MDSHSGSRPISAEEVAASGTATKRLNVDEVSYLRVIWTITDAGAGADIGTVAVKPYTTGPAPEVSLHTLTPVATAATVYSAPVASKIETYDVRGYRFVDLSVVNASAGTRDVTVHVFSWSE